jgi:hypothetical protein
MRAENACSLSYDDESLLRAWLAHYDRHLFGLGSHVANRAVMQLLSGDLPDIARKVTKRTLFRYARAEGACAYWMLGGRVRRRTNRHLYCWDEWEKFNCWLRDHRQAIDMDLSTIAFVNTYGRYCGLFWSRHATIESLKTVGIWPLGDTPARKFVRSLATARDGQEHTEHHAA